MIISPCMEESGQHGILKPSFLLPHSALLGDYVNVASTIELPVGATMGEITPRCIPIPLVADTEIEQLEETFIVGLSEIPGMQNRIDLNTTTNTVTIFDGDRESNTYIFYNCGITHECFWKSLF